MRGCLVLAAVAAYAAAVSAGGRAGKMDVATAANAVSPRMMKNVIAQLQKMKTQVAQEGTAAQGHYQKVASFCLEATMQGTDRHKTSNGRVIALEKEIVALADEIKAKDAESQQLEKDINTEQKAYDDALKEKTDAEKKAETDLANIAQGIKLIEGAIAAVKDGKAPALMQLYDVVAARLMMMQSDLSTEESSEVQRFFDMALGKPTASRGTKNVDGVIKTLEGVLQTFKNQHKARTEKLLETQNTKQTAMGSAQMQLTNKKQFKKELDQRIATLTSDKEAREGERSEKVSDMAADMAFLQDMAQDCEDKAKNYNQATASRNAEVKAIGEAINVLGGDDAAGLAAQDDIQGQQIERAQTFGFLQMRLTAEPKMKALGIVARAARKLHSSDLALVVMRASATGVFDNVIDMIDALVTDLTKKKEDMVKAHDKYTKLVEEQMKQKNAAAKDKEAALAAEAAAEAAKEEARQAKEAAADEESEKMTQLADATKLRGEESEEFEGTKEDMENAIKALTSAVKFLKDFYDGKNAGEVKAMADKREDWSNSLDYSRGSGGAKAGAASTAASEGLKDAMGGSLGVAPGAGYSANASGKMVIALLEQIKSNAENALAAAQKSEDEDVKEFDGMKKALDGEIDDAGKEKDKQSKEQDKQAGEERDKKKAAADAGESLDKAQEQLDNSGDDRLASSAMDKSEVDFEARRAKRNAEIAALKEALAVLRAWKNPNDK
jgi:hypothetical protein